MSGTKVGGQKAVITNKAKHGEDFYRKIGAIGGAISRTGGFYGDPERARIAGIKGGTNSARKRWGTDKRSAWAEAMKQARDDKQAKRIVRAVAVPQAEPEQKRPKIFNWFMGDRA